MSVYAPTRPKTRARKRDEMHEVYDCIKRHRPPSYRVMAEITGYKANRCQHLVKCICLDDAMVSVGKVNSYWYTARENPLVDLANAERVVRMTEGGHNRLESDIRKTGALRSPQAQAVLETVDGMQERIGVETQRTYEALERGGFRLPARNATRPVTDRQLRYLADLARQVGTPPPAVLTQGQADDAIKALKRRLGYS